MVTPAPNGAPMTDSSRSRPSTASSTGVARDSIDLEKQDEQRAAATGGQDLEKQSSPAAAAAAAADAASPQSHVYGAMRNEAANGVSRPATLTQTRSHRSVAGGDGYTVFSEDDDDDRRRDGDTAPREFVVTWEGGDSDPMNPRSMSKLRRWLIVLIVSSSSLCV